MLELSCIAQLLLLLSTLAGFFTVFFQHWRAVWVWCKKWVNHSGTLSDLCLYWKYVFTLECILPYNKQIWSIAGPPAGWAVAHLGCASHGSSDCTALLLHTKCRPQHSTVKCRSLKLLYQTIQQYAGQDSWVFWYHLWYQNIIDSILNLHKNIWICGYRCNDCKISYFIC